MLKFSKSSQGTKLSGWIHVLAACSLVLSLLLGSVGSVQAAATLTVTPITWNVVGLDSNDVTVGPNNFPIGVRIRNTSTTDTATNIQPTFVWDTTDPYINLRAGSYGTVGNPYPVIPSLAPGAYVDVYYEVVVTRNSAAYDHKARYHIAVTADGGVTSSSPTPRELYVEHLISQSRNANFNVYLNGVAVPVGGDMNLYVGQTYTITLTSKTATGGYEQIESFINFPNTIFKINSVSSTYSTVSGGGTTPTQYLYNNACTWESDPNSPNYRSCLGVGKAGNEVVNTYNITILSSSANGSSQRLDNLVYDFSGSSYHYNSDASTTFRTANIIDPTLVTMAKNFSPDPTVAGGSSVLTITLNNPNSATLSDAHFTDQLPISPGIMRVANPANATTSGCGPASTIGYTSDIYDTLTFENGSIAAKSTCVIKINVTVPATPTTGTYTNTTSHLFLGTVDTGNFATGTLDVDTYTAPTPICTWPFMAAWTVPSTATNPPDTGGSSTTRGNATIHASDVTTYQAWAGPGYLYASTDIQTNDGHNDKFSWRANGGTESGVFNTANNDYFAFKVDTSKYTSITMTFWASRSTNGPKDIYIYYSTSGDTPTILKTSFTGTAGLTNTAWKQFSVSFNTGETNATGSTSFFIFGANSVNNNPGADFMLDEISFSGCKIAVPPTLSKAFAPNPVAVDGTSALSFTITNPNTIALSGIGFDDTLPAGVTVATGSSTACGGTLTTTAPRSISFTGGSLIAGGTCTLSVNVTATTGGPHQNISGFIYSTETGTNTTTTGYGTASLTAVLPPIIEKSFAPDPILTGGTSTLTFTLTNPNTDYPLSGVAFDDPLPTTPGAMTIDSPLTVSTTGCGTPTFNPALAIGGTAINLRTATIAAGGTCTVSVNVTATATGKYTNTTGNVSTVINGSTVNGNTASDTLDVQPVHPGISTLKQVSTSPTGPWTSFTALTLPSSVYYRFAIENIGDVPLSSVTLSDPGVNTAICSWKDGDGNPIAVYPMTLPVADALDLQHIAYCIVNTTTPISASSGYHPNTATASGAYLTTTVTDQSTATYATAALSIVKSVLEWAFTSAGDLLHYSFVVTNTGFASLQEPVVINDDHSINETCPSTTTIGDGDAFLDPADHPNPGDPAESITCTATYTVTAADVTSGSVANTASATVSGVTSNNSSATSTWAAMDYDDLPDVYKTLQDVNGPRHTIPAVNGLFMGPDITADTNGKPDSAASLDLDDGVTRTDGELWYQGNIVHLNINLQTSTFIGTAQTGIWIDWNGDGTFNPTVDFIPCSTTAGGAAINMTAGSTYVCAIQIPPASEYTAGATPLNVRVRLFDAANFISGSLDASDYAGLASNGEVEAYQWKFTPTSITLSDFNAHPVGTSPVWLVLVSGLTLVLGLLGFFLHRKH